MDNRKQIALEQICLIRTQLGARAAAQGLLVAAVTGEGAASGATQLGADAILQQQATVHRVTRGAAQEIAKAIVAAGPVTFPISLVTRQRRGDGELIGTGARGQAR